MPPHAPSRLRIARGSRALEARGLDELEPLVAAADPAALARPLRIAVASRSLAVHWSRRLVSRFGALAGVRVQTLYALALEMVERAGVALPGDLLFPIAVRRAARAEPELRRGLDGLDDGYGVVEAATSDLLDAGFEPAHAEAFVEALEEAASPGAGRERALALARVATRSAAAIESGAVGHRSRLYRAAREALERDPERVLPARALFVHGFADVTGRQGDLIEALARLRGARVWIDRPPDPVQPDEPTAGFGERFSERLRAAVGADEDEAVPAPPRLEILHAPGAHAELRGVADRVRALLDAGAEAEEIALVVRHLDAYRVPIRLHFGRLGIPFSGVDGVAPPGPTARRLAALVALLRRGEASPAEGWLDALRALPGRPPLGPGARADLQLGLHVLGAARLAEVASLERGGDDLKLPVRLGLAPAEGEGRHPPRRRLGRALLDAAIEAAAALCAELTGWPARQALDAHRARLEALVREALGWSAASPEGRGLDGALEGLVGGGHGELELERDELLLLLERALEGRSDRDIGGRGGGVQVLDVMEARGRTFEHLFVAGLSRDAFPRTIHEDPLLPDRLRVRLREVLEALPVKGEGHDEERHLFAQLLASAPRVTLSAPVADEDGRARPISPLLERLRFASHAPRPETLPSLFARPDRARPRPAHEHALLAGLHGRRDRFEAVLALALAETAPERAAAAEERARSRCAVLAEIDPGLRASRPLGPYFGFVGPPTGRDPRARPLYVTAAEEVARCAWKGFVKRLLRVEELPDPHGELPSGDPSAAALLIGSLVHRVLERIALDALGERPTHLEEVLDLAPAPLPWPEAAALDAVVARCAEELVRDEGIGLPGYAGLLALHAREPLAWARRIDWPDGRDGWGALGVELEGRVELGSGRALHFKADRVDSNGRALRLVDYKTGKPPSDKVREETRLKGFCTEVAQGKLLQAMAYARAGAARGAASEGRYLYLKASENELPQRVFAARPDDAELGAAFDAALVAVLDAWELGSFVPRLLAPGQEEEHHSCERCEVKEACLRGDSGARRRLARWLARSDPARTDAERAVEALWRLQETAP